MDMRYNQHKPPEGLAEPRTSNELAKLIRKLRWMGLEEEAQRVQNELAVRWGGGSGQCRRVAVRYGLTRVTERLPARGSTAGLPR